MARALSYEESTAIVEFLKGGNYLESAAAAAGVDIRRVRTLLLLGAEPGSEHADFRRDVLRAIAEAECAGVSFLMDAASGGDTRAMMWLLERRYGERWALKVRHVVEEQLSAAVARIEELEGQIGREAVERVLDALAGDPRGPETEVEAPPDVH
jgi:hypothetical protein